MDEIQEKKFFDMSSQDFEELKRKFEQLSKYAIYEDELKNVEYESDRFISLLKDMLEELYYRPGMPGYIETRKIFKSRI